MTSEPNPDPAAVVGLERAAPGDTRDLRRLRHRLEDWLVARGIVQWLPSDIDEAGIGREIDAGEWHVVRRDGAIVAALRLLYSDPGIWGPDEGEDGDAVYVHGLMADRRFAGHRLGESLLDWAAGQGRDAGRSWLRLDCAADNPALREYYRTRGFSEVRTGHPYGDIFPVVLWQRPTAGEQGSPTR